jgi:hypothetical protein
MIITADIILKYPFAVSPRRITDELEILIGLDMAEQARKEGHRKAVPPTIVSKEAQKEATRRKIAVQVIQCLKEHGPKHLRFIRDQIRRDTVNVSEALAHLEAIGALTSQQRKIRGGGISTVYSLSNSPITGQCDPAQPGNPTGTRSDVTTHAVVAVTLSGPGALNPLPANGGM